MLRSWRLRALVGTTAVPVFGDVLTAAVAIPPESGLALITVADTTLYRVGDRIVVDPLQTNRDSYRIATIVTGTTMRGYLEGATGHTHASAALVQLAIACQDVVATGVPANAAATFIGSDNTVTNAGLGNVVGVLEKVDAGVQPPSFHLNGIGVTGQNPFNTAEMWMAGGAADGIIAYALVS